MFDPIGSLKQMLLDQLAAYMPTIIMGVLGLIAAGMGLGMLKNAALACLKGSLNIGGNIADTIAQKPKGLLLIVIPLAIAVPALWAGYRYAPEKIVETPVEKIITRDPEMPVVQAAYGNAETARINAESKVKELERQVATIAKARQDADRRAAEASQRLADVTPPEGVDAAITRLTAQLDGLHQATVDDEADAFDEPAFIRVVVGRDPSFLGQKVYSIIRNPKKRTDRTKYRTQTHWALSELGMAIQRSVYFHRSCSTCSQNSELHEKLDQLYTRQENEKKASKAAEDRRQLAERCKPKKAEIRTIIKGIDHKHEAEVASEITMEQYDLLDSREQAKWKVVTYAHRGDRPQFFHEDGFCCGSTQSSRDKIEGIYKPIRSYLNGWLPDVEMAGYILTQPIIESVQTLDLADLHDHCPKAAQLKASAKEQHASTSGRTEAKVQKVSTSARRDTGPVTAHTYRCTGNAVLYFFDACRYCRHNAEVLASIDKLMQETPALPAGWRPEIKITKS
jgi:hypothetical protein